jgi:hypothetical protein
VIGRSRQILANLEATELDPDGHPRVIHPAQPPPQLSLFVAEPAPVLAPAPALAPEKRAVLDALAALSVDRTTPLEALNLIASWKKQLADV